MPDGLPSEIDGVVKNPDIPSLYANGFGVTVSAGDILVSLNRNSQPIATLNMSFTVAKSLSSKLRQAVELLESITDNSIMTHDFVDQKLKEFNENDNK